MTPDAALYIVATPIGNLEDMSHRAISVLRGVDAIAVEDARHSRRLLNHFGIEKPLLTYNDHSDDTQLVRILTMLESGKQVALISDAGTPLISDPGYRLVVRARRCRINVVPIPGASAPLTALCAAGLPTDRFSFEGFLPAKRNARIAVFEALEKEVRTMLFFESPHRIVDSIGDAVRVFGSTREAVMARELTKTFETFLGRTLGEIEQQVHSDKNQSKGEIVLIIRGEEPAPKQQEIDSESERVLGVLLEDLSVKQSAQIAAKLTGVSRKKLYQYAVHLKQAPQKVDS